MLLLKIKAVTYMIKMIIAMSVSDHTALKEFYFLFVNFYIIFMDIHRVLNSLFLISRSQGSLTVLIPLVLNPIFKGRKTITIQYRDIQSDLSVF